MKTQIFTLIVFLSVNLSANNSHNLAMSTLNQLTKNQNQMLSIEEKLWNLWNSYSAEYIQDFTLTSGRYSGIEIRNDFTNDRFIKDDTGYTSFHFKVKPVTANISSTETTDRYELVSTTQTSQNSEAIESITSTEYISAANFENNSNDDQLIGMFTVQYKLFDKDKIIRIVFPDTNGNCPVNFYKKTEKIQTRLNTDLENVQIDFKGEYLPDANFKVKQVCSLMLLILQQP